MTVVQKAITGNTFKILIFQDLKVPINISMFVQMICLFPLFLVLPTFSVPSKILVSA